MYARALLRSSGLRSARAPEVARPLRRRLATAPPTQPAGATTSSHPAPPPPSTKPRRPFRRFLLTTTLLAATFYGVSTYVSLNNDDYAEFFTATFPGAESLIELLERTDLASSAYKLDSIDFGSLSDMAAQAAAVGKDAYKRVEEAVNRSIGSAEDKAQAGGKEVQAKTGTVVESAKEKAGELSDSVKELVHKAEAALHPSSSAPQGSPDTAPPRTLEAPAETFGTLKREEATIREPLPAEIESAANAAAAAQDADKADEPLPSAGKTKEGKKIYNGPPLPIGFSLPPGYVLPEPAHTEVSAATPPVPAVAVAVPEPAPEHPAPVAEPAPLPLVAPAVIELSASEPVIAQLAETIDNLAQFLRETPAAATSARGVIETAQLDLSALGDRLNAIKEEEKKRLEESLDAQAREYSKMLLEHERDIQSKVDKQEADWRSQFDDERRKLVDAYKDKLSAELETQSELINQRLKEQVVAQGVEMQRRWLRDIKLKVEQERGGRLAKLESLANDVKNLEQITFDNAAYLDENLRVHTLWSALRALERAVSVPLAGAAVKRPFRDELRALRRALVDGKDDDVIAAALGQLEASDAPDTGVESLGDLTAWFSQKVEPKVRQVALVPEEDAGVLSFLASAALSNVLFRKKGLVPGEDVPSVLARAEYYLQEKDLDAAARELNQLTGWAKVLLSDWLREARKTLEVQQALDIAETEATLASLLVI